MAPHVSPGWSRASYRGRRMTPGRENTVREHPQHREDLVPYAVGSPIELAVPYDLLLLRAIDHCAVVEPRVGDEAATSERWTEI